MHRCAVLSSIRNPFSPWLLWKLCVLGFPSSFRLWVLIPPPLLSRSEWLPLFHLVVVGSLLASQNRGVPLVNLPLSLSLHGYPLFSPLLILILSPLFPSPLPCRLIFGNINPDLTLQTMFPSRGSPILSHASPSWPSCYRCFISEIC